MTYGRLNLLNLIITTYENFLIGASGSIGWPLFKFLKKKYKVVGTYNNQKRGVF